MASCLQKFTLFWYSIGERWTCNRSFSCCLIFGAGSPFSFEENAAIFDIFNSDSLTSMPCFDKKEYPIDALGKAMASMAAVGKKCDEKRSSVDLQHFDASVEESSSSLLILLEGNEYELIFSCGSA